jgi:hypothetical protein
MDFAIKVNGATHNVDVDGDTPLLWVLRDVLGMTGTKFGCGMALCGACTVHIDGVATRSCVTNVDSIGSSEITTIEAIGMYRPYFLDRMSAGLDGKGVPIAWNHRFAGSSILARFLPPAFNKGLDPDTTDGAIDLAYALPNMHVEYLRMEPPGIPTAFWRSVGPSHNVFVIESFIDELAAAAHQDPVAYRRALLEKAAAKDACRRQRAEAADVRGQRRSSLSAGATVLPHDHLAPGRGQFVTRTIAGFDRDRARIGSQERRSSKLRLWYEGFGTGACLDRRSTMKGDILGDSHFNKL